MPVTDFVTPNWFAHQNASGPVDFKNHATQPFQILRGGDAQKFDPHRGWQQVNGRRVQGRHAVHAVQGTRRERRARQMLRWTPSEVSFGRRER